MPIYDYACTACRHVVEVIHGINEPGPRFCPSCGAEGTMRKGFTTPAVHFKGSGWAKKDRSTSSSPTKASTAQAETGGTKAEGGGTTAESGGDGTKVTTPKAEPKPATSTAAEGS